MAIILTIFISLFIVAFIGWSIFVSAIPLLFFIGLIATLVVIVAITFSVGYVVYSIKNFFKERPIFFYCLKYYMEELTDDIIELYNKKKSKRKGTEK